MCSMCCTPSHLRMRPPPAARLKERSHCGERSSSTDSSKTRRSTCNPTCQSTRTFRRSSGVISLPSALALARHISSTCGSGGQCGGHQKLHTCSMPGQQQRVQAGADDQHTALCVCMRRTKLVADRPQQLRTSKHAVQINGPEGALRASWAPTCMLAGLTAGRRALQPISHSSEWLMGTHAGSPSCHCCCRAAAATPSHCAGPTPGKKRSTCCAAF